MTLYWKLRTIRNPEHRIHVAKRLKQLRNHMAAEVTRKTSEHDLRLATWNLMHFGADGGYWRDVDALLYIAEIIDHFDLVALQEIKPNLEQLEDLVKNYLGPEWDYIVTDATGGDLGNDERMAYLYRTGKVRFSKIAGEIVLEGGQTIVGSSGVAHEDIFKKHKQFARSPFVVGFQCGWFEFKLCTVHIYYGNPKKPKDMTGIDWSQLKQDYMTMRKTEIREIADFLCQRQEAERNDEIKRLKDKGWDTQQSKANYILLGDFNIVSPEHETFKALEEAKFVIPEEMKALHTNLGKEKRHYDQIAYKLGDGRVEYRDSGALDFREVVFGADDAQHYADVVQDEYLSGVAQSGKVTRDREAQLKYFNSYRFKHQMSDHQLLWASFKVDLAENYLDSIEDEARTS